MYDILYEKNFCDIIKILKLFPYKIWLPVTSIHHQMTNQHNFPSSLIFQHTHFIYSDTIFLGRFFFFFCLCNFFSFPFSRSTIDTQTQGGTIDPGIFFCFFSTQNNFIYFFIFITLYYLYTYLLYITDIIRPSKKTGRDIKKGQNT